MQEQKEKIGRPTLRKDQLPKEFFILYSDYKNKKINKTEMAKMLHVSRVTLNSWIETNESKSN